MEESKRGVVTDASGLDAIAVETEGPGGVWDLKNDQDSNLPSFFMFYCSVLAVSSQLNTNQVTTSKKKDPYLENASIILDGRQVTGGIPLMDD